MSRLERRTLHGTFSVVWKTNSFLFLSNAIELRHVPVPKASMVVTVFVNHFLRENIEAAAIFFKIEKMFHVRSHCLLGRYKAACIPQLHGLIRQETG